MQVPTSPVVQFGSLAPGQTCWVNTDLCVKLDDTAKNAAKLADGHSFLLDASYGVTPQAGKFVAL